MSELMLGINERPLSDGDLSECTPNKQTRSAGNFSQRPQIAIRAISDRALDDNQASPSSLPCLQDRKVRLSSLLSSLQWGIVSRTRSGHFIAGILIPCRYFVPYKRALPREVEGLPRVRFRARESSVSGNNWHRNSYLSRVRAPQRYI